MDITRKEILATWLDLPPSYGGMGLNSLTRSGDDEFLGSFAAIAASHISFCRKTELEVYIRIAEALEDLGETPEQLEDNLQSPNGHQCDTLATIRTVTERASISMSPPTGEELNLATQLIGGHSIVEVPGKWNKTGDSTPDSIVLPEPMTLSDIVTAPCKQEVSLLKQTRQVRQASKLFSSIDQVDSFKGHNGTMRKGLSSLLAKNR
jgi:hypothetical protein